MLRHVLPLPSAHILAIVVTAYLMFAGWQEIRKQTEAAISTLRGNVLTAVDLLAAHENDLSHLKGNLDFLSACAGALGDSEAVVAGRAAFYAALSPEAFGYYGLTGSTLHHSAAIVSLLTDLPVHWIFDLSVNRRGIRKTDDWHSSLPEADRNAALAAVVLDKGKG